MSTFPLSLVTPAGRILEQEVESVTAPGFEGYLGVLAHHAPMITALMPGVLTVKTGEQTLRYGIGEGLLEVSHEGVSLLTDGAIPATDPEDALKKAKTLIAKPTSV